ncbi:hypothetical protein K440DRAFT_615316 [Wilcoxina mikolae CBS 423.85]|nr:hypothetical protein K440DRAFT_615316 [Wilcoxina mikolae CBS 423.85]
MPSHLRSTALLVSLPTASAFIVSTNGLKVVVSQATLSAYLLVFLGGLVSYAMMTKAVGRTVDGVWFYACFLFLNTWISFHLGDDPKFGSHAVNALGVLFVLFVFFGGRRGWRYT